MKYCSKVNINVCYVFCLTWGYWNTPKMLNLWQIWLRYLSLNTTLISALAFIFETGVFFRNSELLGSVQYSQSCSPWLPAAWPGRNGSQVQCHTLPQPPVGAWEPGPRGLVCRGGRRGWSGPGPGTGWGPRSVRGRSRWSYFVTIVSSGSGDLASG